MVRIALDHADNTRVDRGNPAIVPLWLAQLIFWSKVASIAAMVIIPLVVFFTVVVRLC